MTVATEVNTKPDKRVDVSIATQRCDQYVHSKPPYERTAVNSRISSLDGKDHKAPVIDFRQDAV
jgi:hypothetical protein